MTMNAIGWFEVYVKDMPRARKFYEGVFGATNEVRLDIRPAH